MNHAEKTKPAIDGLPNEPVAIWLRMDSFGRLQLPADLLKAAGIAQDEPVCVSAGRDGIHVLSRSVASKRAHSIARRFVPNEISLVDDLIAERRREAKLEME